MNDDVGNLLCTVLYHHHHTGQHGVNEFVIAQHCPSRSNRISKCITSRCEANRRRRRRKNASSYAVQVQQYFERFFLFLIHFAYKLGPDSGRTGHHTIIHSKYFEIMKEKTKPSPNTQKNDSSYLMVFELPIGTFCSH